jgi:hypothetical protein
VHNSRDLDYDSQELGLHGDEIPRNYAIIPRNGIIPRNYVTKYRIPGNDFRYLF